MTGSDIFAAAGDMSVAVDDEYDDFSDDDALIPRISAAQHIGGLGKCKDTL